MANQKKSISLLPSYLQSDTLKKVFSSTVDHLFQEADIEFLNGYIGNKPYWYDRTSDIYIPEPDKTRNDYQLTPAVVSTNYLSGQITNAMFYDDLINQLRFQGANTDNHDRLFSQEYYSWSPPINVDKFVNFGSYFWLPGGPNVITLLETTDLHNNLGKSNFTYKGSYQLSSTGEILSGTLDFINGLKIKPTRDKTLSYNDTEFYVEGIGQGLVLVLNPEDFNPAWDVFSWEQGSWDGNPELLNKQYVTIGRGSVDENIWSVQNRWFHRTVITTSKTYIADQYLAQALRPIIEFDAGTTLYKYGTHGRGIVDILDNGTGDIFGSIVGQKSYKIQNVILQDGMKILATADSHPDINNRIYIVSGVSDGSIQLTLDTSGQDVSGAPALGDRVHVRFGLDGIEGKNVYFNGVAWTLSGQQKTFNNPPLFNLYDIDGNSIDDPSIYPQSNFKGSKVFSYQTSDLAAIDNELGIPTNLDQFGDFIFDNHLSLDQIDYVSDNTLVPYVGDLFVSISKNNNDSTFVNGWWKSTYPSKQYIINDYLLPQPVYQFQIDQEPDDRHPDGLPTIFVTKISTNGSAELLNENVDYTVNGRLVALVKQAKTGERYIIKTWSKKTPQTISGHYEVPLNLSANPNNLPVKSVSRSQILPHFVEIMQNQYGFSGQGIGVNNYGNSAQNRSLGLSILQHRAPMIKLSLLNSTSFSDITSSTSKTDPMLVMEYAQRSYTRFYNRLVQTLLNLNKTVALTGASAPAAWIEKALSIINVGKTTSSPWANSGPTGLPGQYCSAQQSNPTYVPASTARLGITSSYQPIVYFDNSYLTPKLVLQTHDGARIVLIDDQGYQLGTILHNQTSTTNPTQLSNPAAAAWLQFELDMFNSLPARYKDPDYTPLFDIRTAAPGKWRTSDYSRTEFLVLLSGAFDKWCITNQVDYTANTGYDTTNPFSFNYRSVNDTSGLPIPGHWQSLYRWYYDTDRPHTHPWEMLGFTIKPEWWENEYGPAPYTSGNLSLWQDLRDGLVRQGSRAGIQKQFSRPDLLSCIPVDTQGSLLPPFYAGCTRSIPGVLEAQAPWIFGDGGPIESVWINSSDYIFTLAQTAYLMKPAKFIEYNWDNLRTKEIYSGTSTSQWIYSDTNRRRSSQEFYVHRENPSLLTTGVTVPHESNLSYFGSCGFQHWVSEYLISNGYNVTNYLGNVIRGGDVKLAHRMAGFSPADSFRALVDSFGQIGYNSRLVPSENVNLYMYKSGSIGESVYSGVIIEQVKDGWKVRGYDSVEPSFIVITSDPNGPKTNVVVGNQRAVEFAAGTNKTARVLYGTVFSTRQQVYDFLIGYGRWLENQGWIFETYDGVSNTINNWSKSAKEFLFWSQGSWDNGTFITVSPSADNVSFAKQYGNIQFVNGIVSGTYPILDRLGQPIQQKDVDVLRDQSRITVRTQNDQGIFLLRLHRNTLEHAVFFDNVTAFNEVIYQPLFSLRQERILIYAYRAKGWDGRVDIPGYIVVQNQTSNTWTLTSNFDKSADDFKKLYNIEQPTTFKQISSGPTQNELLTTSLGGVDTNNLSKLAKHLIGYQSRDYLQNLLLDDATEFEFYQGFIRQKGTISTLNSLLRNKSIIPAGSSFQYYEEWLLRSSIYGGQNLNQVIEFILPQDRIQNSPHQVRLFSQQDSDIPTDNVFDLVPGDPLIVSPPATYEDHLFTLRTSLDVDPVTDLPTAGYALLGEPTYYVKDQDSLLGLYETQLETFNLLQLNDTVWQFITPRGDWTVWRVTSALSQISNTIPSSTTEQPTIIVTSGPHGLVNGDICVIFGISNVSEINGTFVISDVTPTSFSIDISTFQSGIGGTIWVYRPTRFANIFDRDSNTPPSGWVTGDIAYVDDGGIVPNAWTVYKYLQGKWIPIRQQQFKINANLLLSSELFDSVSKNKLANIDYFDPAKGRISGKADAEISYKTDYDPAKYTNGDNSGYAIDLTESWGNAQIGQVWWDLTTVRYIDYDQGDDTYKIANWGKLAPGTSIDVYEWVRSPIPPADWASNAAQGTTITSNGKSFVPSGSVRNPNSPNWSEYVEQNQDGTSATYYYFWVKNSSMSPPIPTRSLTTQQIASYIQSPSVGDVPWYAAISQRSIIIGNITRYLNGYNTIQRIKYTNKLNDANTFNEWEVFKPNDPYSQPSNDLWQKLKASLITSDGLQNDVPDYKLTDLQKYGSLVRPRQTWFSNRIAASKLFIDTCNSLFASTSSPLVDDSNKILWYTYFMSQEEQPSSSEWDYRVEDIGQRDALIGAINFGQKVLVDAVQSTNNLWTIWYYAGGNDPWVLLRTQAYKTPNYWQYVDWYANGFSTSSFVSQTVETINDLEFLNNDTTGTVVKVLDNGKNKWQLYVYNGASWALVGQQDGSVEILPSIYQWSDLFGGFDGMPFDSTPLDKTAGIEFGYLIDGIKNAIFAEPDSIEINNLFFTMLRFVLSEQGQVDWAIKTSNISLKGFNQPLYTYELLPADLSESIVGFINETKPYHVKITDLLLGKTYLDNSYVNVVDFDVPASFKDGPPENDGSLTWYIWNSTYQSWLKNYKTNGNLIRNLKTSLIFDRIATPGQRTGWGSVWGSLPWSNESQGINYGAIDRIDKYYSPVPGMIPKVVSDLMIGVDYRSTVLDSIALNIDVGWSVSPWDSGVGWEPSPQTLNEYLDVIVQGGQIPRYDSAVGNGISSSFKLLHMPQNPLDMVVWSDGSIRKYGTDWIVPTHAGTVYVLQGGINYSVGDELDVIAGNGLAAARIKVTAVNHGSITDVQILGGGSYNTVTRGPYQLQYPVAHPGLGSDALVEIDWHCETIQFTNPPKGSNEPNIYILYAGTTFEPAPTDDTDTIYSGSNFVIPHVDANHPEELYPLRISDTLMLDTYVRKSGGRPLVTTKVYETDGVIEQFDIGIKPENTESVFVYLNNVLQQQGITKDYVINFVTNRIVFLTAPSPGILRITSISAGGASRSVQSAYPVNGGNGYVPGDAITLAGGVGQPAIISLTGVKNNAATVATAGIGYNVGDVLTLEGGTLENADSLFGGFSVASVTVVKATVKYGGSGYLVNDLVYLSGNGFTSNVVLKVASVGVGGVVNSFAVQSGGEYIRQNAPQKGFTPINQTGSGVGAVIDIDWGVKSVNNSTLTEYLVVPSNPVTTNGAGVGATLNVTWAAARARIINQGLYTKAPSQPLTQLSVSSGNGSGSTWNVSYTSKLNEYIYASDGSTTDFPVPSVTASYPGGILVTVNGVVTPFTRLTNAIRLSYAPAIDSTVIITTFDNESYSYIQETEFSVSNPAVLSYQLSNRYPGHTVPYFLTTLVRKDGKLMQPPVIQTWVSVGAKGYYITVDITSGTVLNIEIYVDSKLMTYGLDYTIINGILDFTTAPAVDSEIILLCTKTDTTYTLSTISGITYINFVPGAIAIGDTITVTTFAEDADYNFVTDEFYKYGNGWEVAPWDFTGWDTNGPAVFPLSAIPYDRITISVWVNGEYLTPNYDYIVEDENLYNGWDETRWDLNKWAPGVEPKTVVRLAEHVYPDENSSVVITYMIGLPEKPPVAWRTLITESETYSTAIDNSRKATVLSNVYTTSTTIEVSDITKISIPTLSTPQYAYINNELIAYHEVQQAPTISNPNRGFIAGIIRNANGTSGLPVDKYAVNFFNGDEERIYFPTESVGEAIAETVWVNENLQRPNVDYTIEIDPPSLPAGRYAKLVVPPSSGYKNVKIASLNSNSFAQNLSHVVGSTIIDAGDFVRIPNNYQWESNKYGIQYSKSSLSGFLLDHTGTRS